MSRSLSALRRTTGFTFPFVIILSGLTVKPRHDRAGLRIDKIGLDVFLMRLSYGRFRNGLRWFCLLIDGYQGLGMTVFR